MPITSRWTIPLPVESLQKHIFTSPTHPLPDKIAFYDAERPESHFLTQEDFRLLSLRFAAGLKKAGLRTGDRVLLFSGNNLFFPVVFMGILMAGGIFTGANPGFVERELAYQLKDSGATFLICSDAALDVSLRAAEAAGLASSSVFIFDDMLFEADRKSQGRLGARNWAALVASEDEGRAFQWVEPADPKEQTCCLNYSSGTTGIPKGVEITHYNYVANVIQYAALSLLHPDEKAKTAKAVWLCFLPLYHAMAQTIYIAGGPKRGIPVYIMKKFDFVQMLEAVQKFKITNLTMVPPIVVALAKSPLTKKYDLSSVTDIMSGAAPLSGEVIEECEALWPAGDVKMKQGWGMTEATCSLLGWDPTVPSLSNSVGELNANCKAKIMDPYGGETEVPVGERGEIWVQAPNVMKGYWNRPSATDEMIVNGPDGRWMKTGDIAYVDKEGRFFIVDRMKELIKVKGNQVAPAELEGILLEHPQVADACVVGVTIRGGEVPRAYCVLQAGEQGDADEIAKWLAKRVSKDKQVTGGVAFLNEIPKNPSGKILRKILREQAKKEVGDADPVPARL